MKLHIAIPAYDGKICVSTAHSLNLETRAMAAAGVETEVSFLPGMPLIHIVRNMQAHKFLNEFHFRIKRKFELLKNFRYHARSFVFMPVKSPSQPGVKPLCCRLGYIVKQSRPSQPEINGCFAHIV